MSISLYRKLILGVNSKVPLLNGDTCQAINFDNAATTPPFINVVQAVSKFLSMYSSVHRGFGYKSQFTTKIYEDSRKTIADFVKADSDLNSIIFVKNTTEAINKLANLLYEQYKDGVILSTYMEHHSNDLPWRKYNLDYIDVDNLGRLSLNDLENKLQKYNGAVKLVTVTGASNITGYKNSIHTIAKIAHKYGAKILVDGAQLVPHAPVDMMPMSSQNHIDFLAFSGHKMYAPFGTGVLIGPKKILNDIEPDYKGGGTIKFVTHELIKWADTPNKDEAGSPNVVGVVALNDAIKTLSAIGMDKIEEHELNLTKYTLDGLRKIPDIKIYYDALKNRIGTIAFIMDGVNHNTIAKILSYESGISVRNGCFCAQPYMHKILGLTDYEVQDSIDKESHEYGLVRISFGFYNTKREIDVLISTLEKIANNKNYYIDKYESLSDELYFKPENN